MGLVITPVEIVGRIRGWLNRYSASTYMMRENSAPNYMMRENLPSVLEEDMDLILIVVVFLLLFGGGGYWGYRRWR
jgi:hypothetical protein